MTQTAPKPFVFTLMPFSAEFHDVYQLGIKAASEESGTYCERVDEQIYNGTILQRIYNQIRTADIIVADMSGRNANVFYEVGYAHALDKQVILLTRDQADIPFDLKHYPHIVYTSVTSLKAELTKRLRWIVANPKEAITYFTLPLRLFFNGSPLQRVIAYRLTRHPNGGFMSQINLEVDVYNSPDHTLLSITFRFGLILPKFFDYVGINPSQYARHSFPSQRFANDSDTIFHLVQKDFTLLPGAWEKFYLTMDNIQSMNFKPVPGKEINFTIRLLTNTGVNDHQTTLKIE